MYGINSKNGGKGVLSATFYQENVKIRHVLDTWACKVP